MQKNSVTHCCFINYFWFQLLQKKSVSHARWTHCTQHPQYFAKQLHTVHILSAHIKSTPQYYTTIAHNISRGALLICAHLHIAVWTYTQYLLHTCIYISRATRHMIKEEWVTDNATPPPFMTASYHNTYQCDWVRIFDISKKSTMIPLGPVKYVVRMWIRRDNKVITIGVQPLLLANKYCFM